jgi:hypothetical protein|tara:strand:+ start:128 stop:487 length:360 start_codon:yes stop_codon:yes gene_type:complete
MNLLIIGIFISQLIVGFLILYFTNYLPNNKNKNTNTKIKDKILQQLILIVNKNCYHIHHWVIFTIFIILMLIGKFTNNYILTGIIGLLIGGILESFLFKDIFWLKNNCNSNILKSYLTK